MAKQARVGLSLWDRLVLLVAWAVTCGLVYLLGFYVGKGTQEQRVGVEERMVRLPVTAPPPAAGQRPSSDSELTFYDTLVSGQHGDGRADAPQKAPAPAPVPIASAKPAAPPTPVAAPPPAVVVAPSTTVPAVRTAPSTTVAPARLTPPAAAPVPSEPPRVATRPAPPTGGGWTVVAELTRNREEADTLQRQLRGHGYDAAVVRVARDGDTWYRVRVGRFSTSAQAEEVRQRLREREGVTHVFVASE